jgi:serine/threonine protein kinase
VYLGMNLETGELMAVKEVGALQALDQEIAVIRTLDHPNIVRYLGTERCVRAPRPCAPWSPTALPHISFDLDVCVVMRTSFFP